MSSRGSMPDRMMNPFSDPQMIARLAQDPRTREFLKDPDYLKLVEDLKSNPNTLGTHLNDKRVLTTLSVLMGMDENMGMMDDDLPTPPRKATPPPSKPKKEEKMEVDLTPVQKEVHDMNYLLILKLKQVLSINFPFLNPEIMNNQDFY